MKGILSNYVFVAFTEDSKERISPHRETCIPYLESLLLLIFVLFQSFKTDPSFQDQSNIFGLIISSFSECPSRV